MNDKYSTKRSIVLTFILTMTAISYGQDAGNTFMSYNIGLIWTHARTDNPEISINRQSLKPGLGAGCAMSLYVSHKFYTSVGMRLEYSSYKVQDFFQAIRPSNFQEIVIEQQGSVIRKSVFFSLPIQANIVLGDDKLCLLIGSAVQLRVVDNEKTNVLTTEYYYKLAPNSNIWLSYDPPRQYQIEHIYHPTKVDFTLGAGFKAKLGEGRNNQIFAFINADYNLIDGTSFWRGRKTFLQTGIEWRNVKKSKFSLK